MDKVRHQSHPICWDRLHWVSERHEALVLKLDGLNRYASTRRHGPGPAIPSGRMVIVIGDRNHIHRNHSIPHHSTPEHPDTQSRSMTDVLDTLMGTPP